MKPPKELIRLIQESQITTGPEADERILHDARNEMETRRRDNPAPLDAVLWRALMKNKMTKFGTAFVVIIVAVVAFQFLGNPFGNKLTFASVTEPILNAGTASFDVLFGPEDDSVMYGHDAVMGSITRRTMVSTELVEFEKVALIIDFENGRMLALNGIEMKAQYTDLKGLPSIQNQNWLEVMKNSISILKDDPDFIVEELGRKQLDGKEVVGFFASHPKVDLTIWADVDTGLPVRVEQNVGQVHLTLKNIEFDLPMEEDLFSMEVPAGYTVQEPMTMDFQAGTEASFIEGLRLIAEVFNDGYFPDGVSLEDFMNFLPEFAKQSIARKVPEEVAKVQSDQLREYALFIRFFKGEGEWTYRGKGVRLGEAETPIFWYRPEKSETYHVIYGDLHVEHAYPEDLPE